MKLKLTEFGTKNFVLYVGHVKSVIDQYERDLSKAGLKDKHAELLKTHGELVQYLSDLMTLMKEIT